MRPGLRMKGYARLAADRVFRTSGLALQHEDADMPDEAETIERAALGDVYAAVPPAVRARLGVRILEVDGAFAGLAPGLPRAAIVLNRAIGLGVGQPATANGVSGVIQAYRDAGVARFFIHAHADARPDALRGWIEDEGLVRARGWQKFRRDPLPPPGAATELEVREIGAEHGESFARIACAAFDLGEEAVEWLAELPGRKGWRIVMAFHKGKPAATGALFVHGGTAWFDWAATSPEFRRRGAQATLLDYRVRLALESGCRTMYTATGEAVTGDPQHSYSNILRAGFRETRLRENYAPPR